MRQADANTILSALGVDVMNNDSRYDDNYVSINYDKAKNSAAFSLVTEKRGRVPNVVGMGLKDAVYLAEKCGMRVKVSYLNADAPAEAPVGKVFKQSHDAGGEYKKGDVLTVYLK